MFTYMLSWKYIGERIYVKEIDIDNWLNGKMILFGKIWQARVKKHNVIKLFPTLHAIQYTTYIRLF